MLLILRIPYMYPLPRDSIIADRMALVGVLLYDWHAMQCRTI